MKLEETIRILYDAGVEFVVIGGAAMGLQGSAHLTLHEENRDTGSVLWSSDLARFDASVVGRGMLDKMRLAPIPEIEL